MGRLTKVSAARIAVLGTACVALGAAAGPPIADGAESLKDVIVRNTSNTPVPTTSVGTTLVSGTVNVGNASSEAVPVEVTNTAGEGTPVQIERRIELADGDPDEQQVAYTVPSGKRLEVEFTAASVAAGEHRAFAAVRVGGVSIGIPLQRLNAASDPHGATPVTLFADAGETVNVVYRENSATNVRAALFVVTGRLVDAP